MATLSVTFDEKKLAKLQKKLGPDIVMPPLGALLDEAARFTQREAASRAPSLLARIIEREVKPLSARVVLSHPGARAMEAGRKPLVAGGKFPPPDAFLALAGGSRERAFVIARGVARRGTKGRFFMKKAKAALNRQLRVLAERLAKAIGQRWAD